MAVKHANNGPFTTLPQGQTAWEANHTIENGTIIDAMLGLTTPALGTPSSGVATNLTGTAAGLTAGHVTTNANLTGDVTSTGNATTIGAGKVTASMLAADASALAVAEEGVSIATAVTSLNFVGSTITASIASVYASLIVADGAVGYWRLGESSGTTAVDQKGAQDGTYVNTPTLGATGALTLDTNTAVALASGSSQYVSVANNAIFNVGTGAQSWEFWVKQVNLAATYVVADKGGNTVGGALQVRLNNDASGDVNVRIAGGSVLAHTAAVIADANYHHIVVTKASGTTSVKIYVDSVDVTITDTTGACTNNAAAVRLGSQDGAGPFFYLNGTLDEPAFYQTALSAATVAAHYAAGTAPGASHLVTVTATPGNLSGDVSSSGLVTTIGAGKVTEAMQVLADNTTNNASTSAHGYLKKLDNNAAHFMDGTGAWSTPGASLTSSMNQLSGNVTMTNANTFYDGPTLTLAAGTWLLIAACCHTVGSSSTFTMKIWDGTTVAASASDFNTAGGNLTLSCAAIVSPGTSTTYKASSASQVNASTILAAAAFNGTGNNVSTLVAVRLA